MRTLRFIATASAALLALAPSAGHAESRWSSAAGAGLAFTNIGVGSGLWADLLYQVAPNWSVGVEAGYTALARAEQYVMYAAASPFGYVPSSSDDNRLASASLALRGRSPGPVRFHFLGTVGCYDLATKVDPVAYPAFIPPPPPPPVFHQQYPGFSLGVGVSAAGPVRPALQVRWHQVIRPHYDFMDVVTFEAGLHFN